MGHCPQQTLDPSFFFIIETIVDCICCTIMQCGMNKSETDNMTAFDSLSSRRLWPKSVNILEMHVRIVLCAYKLGILYQKRSQHDCKQECCYISEPLGLTIVVKLLILTFWKRDVERVSSLINYVHKDILYYDSYLSHRGFYTLSIDRLLDSFFM